MFPFLGYKIQGYFNVFLEVEVNDTLFWCKNILQSIHKWALPKACEKKMSIMEKKTMHGFQDICTTVILNSCKPLHICEIKVPLVLKL